MRYLGTARTAQALHIFLELVPGGSIAGLLDRFGPFGERVVAAYTRQVLAGLAYLHSHAFMHRDIKGANLLVDGEGTVKLADFGASRDLQALQTIESGVKSVQGTPFWRARGGGGWATACAGGGWSVPVGRPPPPLTRARCHTRPGWRPR